jgi:hypothetical protein
LVIASLIRNPKLNSGTLSRSSGQVMTHCVPTTMPLHEGAHPHSQGSLRKGRSYQCIHFYRLMRFRHTTLVLCRWSGTRLDFQYLLLPGLDQCQLQLQLQRQVILQPQHKLLLLLLPPIGKSTATLSLSGQPNRGTWSLRMI